MPVVVELATELVLSFLAGVPADPDPASALFRNRFLTSSVEKIAPRIKLFKHVFMHTTGDIVLHARIK